MKAEALKGITFERVFKVCLLLLALMAVLVYRGPTMNDLAKEKEQATLERDVAIVARAIEELANEMYDEEHGFAQDNVSFISEKIWQHYLRRRQQRREAVTSEQ